MEKIDIVTIIKPSQFNKDKTIIKCAVCKENLPLKAINSHKRANMHLRQLRTCCHANTKLQKCFDEYGEAAFSFLLLEECEPEKLDEREYYWLKRANVHQTKMSFNMKMIEN